MTTRQRSSARPLYGFLLALTAAAALVLSGCSSTPAANPASASAAACPTTPTNIVVTTNVWASVVDQLVGACANVSTVITNSAADPHDFEPTAETSSLFSSSQLVVMNGLGYDEWANKIVSSLGADAPPVLNLGDAVGLKLGANPHIWYSPDYVQKASVAISAEVKEIDPKSSDYFDTQAASFATALKPYLDKIASIKAAYSGTNIGATETVFNYMAAATGLVITTPPGFIAAIATDSEPSTRDVATFREQLSDGTDKVLIFNSQTKGGLPNQMRDVAQSNNVPVVTITESLNPADSTFQAWQIAQLDALAQALAT